MQLLDKEGEWGCYGYTHFAGRVATVIPVSLPSVYLLGLRCAG